MVKQACTSGPLGTGLCPSRIASHHATRWCGCRLAVSEFWTMDDSTHVLPQCTLGRQVGSRAWRSVTLG